MKLYKTLKEIDKETGRDYVADVYDEFIAMISHRNKDYKSLFIFKDNSVLIADNKNYDFLKGSKSLYRQVKYELLKTEQVEILFKTFYFIYTMKIR